MVKATVQHHGTLEAQADIFAHRAHAGQKRKGTQWDYITHPVGVAHLLREHYPEDAALIAAGYLHDVLEDTPFETIDLRERFGDDVTELVLGVTNDGDWRLSDYIDNPRVLRLKAADTVDNIRDTIRGLEKGHDVWSRFSAGRRKAQTWAKHRDIIIDHLYGEPLALELHRMVVKVQTL